MIFLIFDSWIITINISSSLQSRVEEMTYTAEPPDSPLIYHEAFCVQ
jgi:hypothetical protein